MEHRKSILHAFSFSLAGLVALGAALIGKGELSVSKKIIVFVLIVLVCKVLTDFIKQQRVESERSRSIMIKIEEMLHLYDRGAYVKGESVYPDSFRASSPDNALSKGDRFLVGCLLLVALMLTGLLVAI